MLHLPKGSYYRAHVLAVSDGQKGKDPVLTLRSGAFQGLDTRLTGVEPARVISEVLV